MEHKCDVISEAIHGEEMQMLQLQLKVWLFSYGLVFHLWISLFYLGRVWLWKQHNAAEKVNMVHFSSENQLSLIPYWKGRSKLERYFANYSKWNILFAIYFVEGACPDSQSPTFRDRFTGRQTDSDTWIYKFIISSFLQLKHFTKRGTSSLSDCSVFILNSRTFLAAKT